ncbi:hypothetical protein JTB14_014200 [Gonioctena quinquepunctata]|nr:hypothetical protein JTB14_014200 [Gonioctena quinquepunctata]
MAHLTPAVSKLLDFIQIMSVLNQMNGKKTTVMSRKFNLTKITSEEAFDLLDGITEEQDINSDLERDSDA